MNSQNQNSFLFLCLAFGLNISQDLEFIIFLHAFLFQQAKKIKISNTQSGLDCISNFKNILLFPYFPDEIRNYFHKTVHQSQTVYIL